MSRSVAILSHTVFDILSYPDVTERIQIGGAGAYAAVGAAIATKDAAPVLVSGVGYKDKEELENWAKAQQIIPNYFVFDEHSPKTHVRYSSLSDRIETSLLGGKHFNDATPYPRHIAEGMLIGSIYVFHDVEDYFWQTFFKEIENQYKVPIIWEIAANACIPKNLKQVTTILDHVDLLSINIREVEALHDGDIQKGLQWAETVRADVVIHAGVLGTALIPGTSTFHMSDRAWVGIAPTTARDVTGGGNSFTGALTQALNDGTSLVDGTALGAAVASQVVSSFGPPNVTNALRQKAHETSSRIPVSRGLTISDLSLLLKGETDPL